MIRVFIADDQLLVRQGIRTLLEMGGGIAIAGEAADGAATIAEVPALQLDVLLLDMRMPQKSGLAVLRELATQDALPPTLILTTFEDSHALLDGIRAGARGFMLKDASYEQLIRAVRAIAAGETVFQPALTERLLRVADRVHVGTGVPPERLTAREIEVVRLMSGGCSNREIAYALGTAEGTSERRDDIIKGQSNEAALLLVKNRRRRRPDPRGRALRLCSGRTQRRIGAFETRLSG